MEAPTLTTARLRLRPHRAQDLPFCAAMWASPDVTRFIGGRPFTAEDTWARILRYAGHWKLLGFGYWLAEEIATGRSVGELGFADYHRELTTELRRLPESGWVFSPEVHGRGYATEAVSAILAWADAEIPGAPQTWCMINPANEPSIRLAGRCGYRLEHEAQYHGNPVLVFARARTSSSDKVTGTTTLPSRST